ncbi:hypothetical protein DFH09DRAFT_1076272 [Mycena vulgaris]|nr:hypothetical protein DFH09DRAFT_1076272 [Mycena vulgaris]
MVSLNILPLTAIMSRLGHALLVHKEASNTLPSPSPFSSNIPDIPSIPPDTPPTTSRALISAICDTLSQVRSKKKNLTVDGFTKCFASLNVLNILLGCCDHIVASLKAFKGSQNQGRGCDFGHEKPKGVALRGVKVLPCSRLLVAVDSEKIAMLLRQSTAHWVPKLTKNGSLVVPHCQIIINTVPLAFNPTALSAAHKLYTHDRGAITDPSIPTEIRWLNPKALWDPKKKASSLLITLMDIPSANYSIFQGLMIESTICHPHLYEEPPLFWFNCAHHSSECLCTTSTTKCTSRKRSPTEVQKPEQDWRLNNWLFSQAPQISRPNWGYSRRLDWKAQIGGNWGNGVGTRKIESGQEIKLNHKKDVQRLRHNPGVELKTRLKAPTLPPYSNQLDDMMQSLAGISRVLRAAFWLTRWNHPPIPPPNDLYLMGRKYRCTCTAHPNAATMAPVHHHCHNRA